VISLIYSLKKEKEFEEFLNFLLKCFEDCSNSSEIQLSVTGYHSDSFISFIEKYLKTFKLPFVFKKEKQVLSTIFGLFVKLKGSLKNFMYVFEKNRPIIKMHEINSSYYIFFTICSQKFLIKKKNTRRNTIRIKVSNTPIVLLT